MDRNDPKTPALSLSPLRDEDLRGATGGATAITTIGFPVQYRSRGPDPRFVVPAGAFDVNLHGWGHHH